MGRWLPLSSSKGTRADALDPAGSRGAGRPVAPCGSVVFIRLGLAAILAFAYGPVTAQAFVLALAPIVLPWWFLGVYPDR